MENVVVMNEQNFDSEIASGVVLVDFWAEWCGRCQVMHPNLAKFADDTVGSVKVGKVNVDDAPWVAAKFRVMSIPTLIVFKDGKAVEQMVGVQSPEKLKEVTGKYTG